MTQPTESSVRAAVPTISIVTPSFNQREYVEHTLQSVLQQNYPALEYVVVDGGSTDGSAEFIRRHAHALHACISERDEGHGHALNKGFALTTGEVMAWLNSDDMYTPWAFRVVAEIFSRFPHVEWLMGLNAWWNCDGVMTKVRHVTKNVYDYLLGDFGWIQQESVFWRRSLWEKAGGRIDQGYRFMVDGELWTRFFRHAPLYTIDAVLGGYRSHGANRAKLHYDQCRQEMRQAINAMAPHLDQQTLSLAKALAQLRTLKRRSPNAPVDDAAFCQTVSPEAQGLLLHAAYHHIAWRDEKWVEGRLPFRL